MATPENLVALVLELGKTARATALQLALLSAETKTQALKKMAHALQLASADILLANQKDVKAAAEKKTSARFS